MNETEGRVSVFSIPIGGKCEIEGIVCTVKRHSHRKLPRIGRVLICECVDNEKKKYCFFTNYEVKPL